MDDHITPQVSSSDCEYHGVLIKNDQFLVSVQDDLFRLRPNSGDGPAREFSKSNLFDVASETDSNGLPSLVLAINTSGGIKRMVLSFSEGAGGVAARDRLIRQVRGIINGVHSKSGQCEKEALKTISGVLIKGLRFRLGIGSFGITLTPESGNGPVREYPRSALFDPACEADNGDLPSFTLAIKTKGGIQRMILSFPQESGGSSARDQTLHLILGIINGKTAGVMKKAAGPVHSVSGITIKDVPFKAELSSDLIRLVPEAGDGAPREFRAAELFDVVPEFTPDGIQSAVLAIQTATGIRRMVLCFADKLGGTAERDRFTDMVRGIIDGTFGTVADSKKRLRRDQCRTEYPICQRSGLSLEGEEIGLLLTSKRLLVYEGGGRDVLVREEFRSHLILDASPTIDLSGKPAMAISIISPDKEISGRIFVFDDESERNSWISLLTADELPPPMFEETDDEVVVTEESEIEIEVRECEVPQEDEEEELPDPPEEDQKPPVNRCPVCSTILPYESPWCDLCGTRLTSERDLRIPGESDQMLSDDPLIIRPRREYGRFLTFLIAPSGAGRFKDDPLMIPVIYFLTSILVCVLGSLGIVSVLLHRSGGDSTLYPILTELTTDPVVFAIFTITILCAAAVAVLIASLLAFLIIGRVEGSLGGIIRITLYATLPFGIAGLIPIIGVLVAGCWSVIIVSGALRKTFDFSVPASFFPPVISYAGVFFAAILLTGGVF
ncbi:MAG: Yip1 family protein [Methanocalculus sp.]|uniref:Yip1 family protein n=1 Tax=Methanocalculus sp. TaxID=2004547 RepID=UPI00271D42F7|nr:Yip1 family protein [Methanocalculus sp.]MDO9540306.1 Yip1 family protein [Methanocalculus sp.]